MPYQMLTVPGAPKKPLNGRVTKVTGVMGTTKRNLLSKFNKVAKPVRRNLLPEFEMMP